MAELKAVPLQEQEDKDLELLSGPGGPDVLTMVVRNILRQPGRSAKQALRGLANIPADVAGTARLSRFLFDPVFAGQYAAEKVLGVPEAAQTAGAMNRRMMGAEKELETFADKLVPIGPPQTTGEQIIRGGVRGGANPLNLIPPGPATNVVIGGAVGSALEPVAPEARATVTPLKAVPVEDSQPLRAVPLEGDSGTAPSSPGELRAVPVEEGGLSTADIGLGAAGAVAAALLGRKALQLTGVLKKPIPGKAIESIGEPLDARIQRPSATTPGEAIQTLQADKTAVLRSQAARSVEGVQPTAPIESINRPVDVYSTGIPAPGTFGERSLLLPGIPNVPRAPFAPGTTVEQAVKYTDEMLPRATPEQVTMRMQHAFETGDMEIAGRRFRIIPPKQILDDWAMRGPEHAAKVDEAMALARALDAAKKDQAPILTRLLSGQRPTVKTPSGVDIPQPFAKGVDKTLRAQAEARYAQLMQDPAVYNTVSNAQGSLKVMMQNAIHAGYPQSKINKFFKMYPRFMPIQEQGKEARNPNLLGRVDRFWRELGEADPHVRDSMAKFEEFMKASTIHGQGVQNPANFADSFQRYFATYHYAMERNHAKRTAFYFLRNSKDPDIAKSFTVFKKGDKGAPENTNWFWDGEHYLGVHFKDPLMNTAFKLNPHHIKWNFNYKLKQGFQQGTTSLANPKWLFAKGIFFDHLFGGALRPAGTKDWGGISGLLTLGHGRFASDPTKIAHNAIEGASRVLAAKAKLAMAEAAEQAVARGLGPGWSRFAESVWGPGTVQRLGQAMRQAYEDSTYAWLRREGAVGQTQFFERNIAMNTSRLEQAVPAWQKLGHPTPILHRVWQFYKDILEAFAQSYRVQYAHYNRARKGVAQEAVDLLGTFTRRGLAQGVEGPPLLREAHTASQQLGNMLARTFGGKFARTAGQAMMDTIPYYNVFVQATSKLGQRLSTTSGMSGAAQTIILPAIAAQLYLSYDKELSDWYRQLPGQYRATTLFIPMPFMQGRPPEQRVLSLPVAPEFSILHAGTSYVMAELLGNNKGYMQDDIRDSIASWLNIPFIGGAGMPPLVQAFGALAGADLRGARVQSWEGGQGVLPSMGSALRTERITGQAMTQRPGALLPAQWEGFAQGLLGTVASMAIGFAEAGLQTVRKPGSTKEDIGAAMLTQLGNDQIRNMPVYRPIHGFYQAQAMSNMKRRLGERGQLVDRITNAADALIRGPATSKGFPAEMGLQPNQMAAFMRDPVFTRRLLAVKMEMDRDGGVRFISNERNALRRQLETLGGQRPLTRTLQQKINVLRARELGLTERLYDLLKAKEQKLGFRLEDADPARLLSTPPGVSQR